MNVPPASKLLSFLQKQRWFSRKEEAISAVSWVDQATLSTSKGEVLLALFDVRFELGHVERYLLPLWLDEKRRIHDAISESICSEALFRLIQAQESLSTSSGRLRGLREAETDSFWNSLSSVGNVRKIPAEQTHTSVVFNESLILKVFRQLEPGLSPEVEMGRFLQKRHFPHLPQLMGTLSLEGHAPGTLAVAHRFFPLGLIRFRGQVG